MPWKAFHVERKWQTTATAAAGIKKKEDFLLISKELAKEILYFTWDY